MSKTVKDKFLTPECNSKCRSKKDAKKLINVITRSSDEASLIYLATSGICKNPGKVTDNGRSLLHLAASLGKRSVAEWLIRFKEASINGKDQESGYTPLHRSLFHGHVDMAKYLIDAGANPWIQDHDGLIPFDHLVKDRILQPGLSLPANHKDLCEVYLWGTNANFNLGLGHQQQRPQPEIADQFRKEGIYFKQLALQKFHSAFLTTSGQALTCGHGQGGRLGLGTEDPQLTPHPIKVPLDQTCISVALGVDHSMFLMSNGVVWTCGSNAYHQLGHQPPPRQLTTPQAIPAGGKSKLPYALGIGAARFHSLLWTRDGLYTWGLNAGQIGHLKADDKTIVTPKFVTPLNDKKIRDVSTSDGSIVVLTEAGDVIALHDFSTRRILSAKQFDVVKMVATGGHLDPRIVPNSDLVEHGGEELKVFFLTRNGRVFIWQDNRHQTQATFSVFNASKELWVADLCVGKGGSLFVLTKEGDGYELSHSSRSNYTLQKSESLSEVSKSGNQKSDIFLDILKVKSRLPCVYRAVSISCDPKGKNFGVLQVSPNAELSDIPEVDSSTTKEDFRNLYDQTDEYDPLHDLEIKVGNRTFFAHKFIVASSCEKLSKLVRPFEDYVQISEPIAPEIFEQVLQFIYFRNCDLMKVGPTNFRLKKVDNNHDQKETENQDGNKYFSVAGDPSTTSAFRVYAENGKNSSKSSKKVSKKSSKQSESKSYEENPISALHEAAKLLGMTNLVARISQFRYSQGVIEQVPSAKSYNFEQLRYSRKSFPEFYDVSIKSEDGVEVSAHRCILSARLDYFRSMFATGCWIEGSKNRALSLPVPARVMTSMLDYIYSDEFPAGPKNSDEPEFYCNLLVTADQFLVPRLIQMCERHLAGMLTLKNVGEVLQFAHDFNAVQLKRTSMQFSSQNLGALLESKGLDTVNIEVLQDLSTYYRSTFRAVDSRRITPYEGGPSTDDIDQYFDDIGLTKNEVFSKEEDDLIALSSPSKSATKKKNVLTTSRTRTLSTESIGSITSDSDDERRPTNKVESIFDDFEFEEKDFFPKAEDANSHHLKEDQKNGDAFLSSFFAGPNHDVIPTVRKPPPALSTSKPKRFTKMSQKELKKLSTNSAATTKSPAEKETSPMGCDSSTSKWVGWSTKPEANVEKPKTVDAPSLAEIMRSEREVVIKSPVTTTTERKMSPADVKINVVKKSSWRQLSFEEEKAARMIAASSSPPKNPWKIPTAEMPMSTMSDSSTNFKQILNQEKKESENLFRAATKPLWVTQIEEKAIEELKVFYNVDKCFDENVKVSRVDEDRILATPIWKKNLSSKK